MATGSSTQYTIGTALDRAHQQGLEVEVLVEGHWLTGKIAAADGLGVVLDREGVEHFVVRLDRISSVRVGVRAPTMDVSDPVAAGGPDRTPDGAVPMPAPTADEADQHGQQYLSGPQALSA